MGLFDKVKKVFLEDVEEEVEEKEEPVAKKIALPKTEKKEEKPEIVEQDEEDVIIDLVDEEEPIAPVVEEKRKVIDFSDEDLVPTQKRSRIDVSSYSDFPQGRRSDKRTEVPTKKEIIKEEFTEYDVEDTPVVEEVVQPTSFEDVYGKEKPVEEHGLYEGRNQKKSFTPTPVISPVYGILDKNYKKDDVVSKKEIRLSSATPKKMDLDQVREKAYGDLTNDISQSMQDIDIEDEIVDLSEDKIYDLNESDGPVVQKVTIGDAEEYFNDLGLEYNNDYKDNSTTTKRRSEKEEIVEDEFKEEEKEVITNDSEEGLESNLFDLIESMYEEKE